MLVIIECITTLIVKLVNKANCKSPDNLNRECWKKIYLRYIVGRIRSDEICNRIYEYQNDWRNNEITNFQDLIKLDSFQT